MILSSTAISRLQERLVHYNQNKHNNTVMLAIDLTLDPSTTITAGTSSPTIYSLLNNVAGSSIRSAAAVAQTNPENFKISHSVRTAKGFKTVANASVPAPDVVFDRHLCRLDVNCVQTTHIDTDYRVNRSVQIVLEVPRLGGSTPTAAQLVDDLLSVVSMLRASSNANLVRILNGEV